MKNLTVRNNVFDDDLFFDDVLRSFSSDGALMKTDIKETPNEYKLVIDIPGFKKENIKISLEDKYLTIKATYNKDDEEKDTKILRRERYYGSYQRSYYVGDVSEEAIKAKFENGILEVSFPKDEYNKKEQRKYISIS